MKGLILKDLIVISKNIKVIAGLFIFYLALAFMSEDAGSFISIFTLLFALYTLMTYSYDEMARWDSYALTMPLSKDNIVQGKYLLMLLLSLFSFLFNSVLEIAINLYKHENLFKNMKFSALGSALIIFLFSIVIPIITKYGIEKARLIFVLIYIIPFTFGTIIFRKIKELYPNPPAKLVSLTRLFVQNARVIIPVFSIALLAISYFISIRIYRKKEF